MNCQEFWEQERGTLDHLEECPACAARYARHEGLGQALRTVGAEWRRAEAPASVERRLVAAFRGQFALGAPPARTGWFPLLAWGTALAATALAGMLFLRPHEPQRTRHFSRNPVQLALVETAEPADPVVGFAEGYEDFIPLPNAETLAPNEPVNVVRLEVPRSAMIPLGYAVSEEHASERVEADVMLGADGVARAVRFVTDGTNY